MVAAMLASPCVARADDPDHVTPAPEKKERSTLIVGNTPALLVGRLSFDFGTFVAPHVVPTASLHAQATVMFGDEQLYGVGGELGMRLYGGERRPTGPFIGMYALGGRYANERGAQAIDVISYGGAADLGWSFCTKARNVVVALGFGAEIRGAQENGGRMGDVAEVFLGRGPRPRALVQVGAFF